MSDITAKAFRKIIQDIDADFGASFCGMRIYEEPLPPAKLQLSKKLDLDPFFRAEYNRWLLDRFGRQKSMLDNKFLVSERFGFAVAPFGGLHKLTTVCGA